MSAWLNSSVGFPDAEFHNLSITENNSGHLLTVAEQTLCGMYTPSASLYDHNTIDLSIYIVLIDVPFTDLKWRFIRLWLIFNPMDIIASQSSIASPFHSRIDRANPLFTL